MAVAKSGEGISLRRFQRFLAIIGALTIVGGLLSCTYLYVLTKRGLSSLDKPSALEQYVAEGVRRISVPRRYREARNPLPSSAENRQAGMSHFADHCAACHGNDGRAQTLFGQSLYPRVPELRQSISKMSDGEIYYVIQKGVRLSGMPAFGSGDAFDDEATWKLVIFLRQLPDLTEEDLQTMKSMNPQSSEHIATDEH